MTMKLKNSIPILLTLIAIVSSVVDEFSLEDLRQLQKTLHESSAYMTRKVKEEDAVILVGATRSGKSTLINYLIGNELVAEKGSRGHPVTIRKVDPLSEGPAIGSGPTSKTKIPTRWISRKLPHLAIWDSPGFDDNRGPVQDITNAFYLYQLLQKVRSLRVALAVDINDILKDNVEPFVSVLNAVEDLLGHKNKIHSLALTVIFTKVPDTLNDEPVDIELINGILSQQFLSSNMSLSQASKDIIESLINNSNRIAFFKRAKPGLVTSAIDVNIFPAIESTSQLEKDTLKELHPRISDKSKICLFKARNVLLPKGAFNDLEKVVRLVIDRKVQDLVNHYDTQGEKSKVRAHITQLEGIERQLSDALTHESDFYIKMEIIQSIDRGIKREIEEHNLLEKIQLMEFVDKLLDLEESDQYSLSLQGVLISCGSIVREAITSAQLRLGEITWLQHKELMEEERKKHQEVIENLKEKLEEAKRRNEERENSFLEKLSNLLTPVLEAIAEAIAGKKETNI